MKIVPKFCGKKIRSNYDKTIILTNKSKYCDNSYFGNSFEEAIKFPMILGQYLCLIPLSQREFKWCSIRAGISVTVTCCQIIMASLSLLWMNRSGLSIFKSGSVLFFGGAAIMMILMIRFAFMWSKLLTKWMEIEIYFGYQKHLKKIFAIISVLIIVFSTVEHLSNLIFGLVTASQKSKCVLKKYSSKMFPQVFEIASCTIWRIVPVLYINSVSTLIYSFGDQLIIMISLALGNYFKMFNDSISLLKGKHLTALEWKTLRLKYTKLCELTYVVDDCLCHLLCLAFVIHLYIICVQMHHGMLYMTDCCEKMHAILLFSVSVLRACALCYTTVRVYEQSKNLLQIFYSIPSSTYCIETELFLQQLLHNETVLTGSHMFSMKRSFLLTIGGTMVSYEIILLQMRDFRYLNYHDLSET